MTDVEPDIGFLSSPLDVDESDPEMSADLDEIDAYFAAQNGTSAELTRGAESLESPESAAAHGWSRVDLRAYIGLPPQEPDIGGLFYAGRRHLVSGPGEAMKTWLCLIAAVAEVKSGRGVIWADLDGMGPRDIAARLVAFGVTEEEIDSLVYFTNPEGRLGDREIAGLLEWAAGTQCRLMTSDAFTGFLVAHGLDGDKGLDVEKAWQLLDPFCEAGIAVSLIDHVVKTERARKGQAIGSERKGTASYLHFDLVTKQKLTRGGTGRSRMDVSRDRGAFFGRPAGELVLHSDADTGAITWKIDPPKAEGEPFRPTGYMEKVSRHVEGHPGQTKTAIVEEAGLGAVDHLKTALAVLIDEEFVRVEDGPRRAQLHYSLTPFREADDSDGTPTDWPSE